MTRLLFLILLAALAGCANSSVWQVPADGEGDSGAPADTTGSGDPSWGAAAASGALLKQSRMSQAAGQYEKAASDIERAIRIEPRNPYLWLELARIHLATGDSQQAAALAQKALLMADSDTGARRAAQQLLDEASAM